MARRILWSWLRQHKTNRTLLISSHLLDEVEELCDSIIILDSGKVHAQGTILELKRQFGPPGDRLHLDNIPAYIPKEWIIDGQTHFIQVPNRTELIRVLKQLEQDNIKYSLENITLDDIFLKLTSSTEFLSSGNNRRQNLISVNLSFIPFYGRLEENTVDSSIDELFKTRTTTRRSYLWFQQILGVLIRRGQVFLRQARLLPVAVLIYLAYALAPLYTPSFALTAATPAEYVRYIVSASSELMDNLSLKNLDIKFTPSLYSSREFEEYLLSMFLRRS